MRTTILILFFSAVFLGCQAHMCLLSPAQRGSMTMFNKAASGDCHLMTSPCGGRAMDDVRLYLRAGQNFTVVFQKNLDHWNSATPGDFTGMIIFYIFIPFFFNYFFVSVLCIFKLQIGHFARKSVSGVSDEVPQNPGCTATVYS